MTRSKFVIALAALFLTALPVQSETTHVKRFEAPCVGGLQWHGANEFAALTYCEEEEPPHVIALQCTKGENELTVELDFTPPRGEEPKGPILAFFKMTGWSHTFETQPNYLGLYERLVFKVTADDPFITQLRQGQSGSLRVLGKETSFHLSGSSSAIKLMLENCGIE